MHNSVGQRDLPLGPLLWDVPAGAQCPRDSTLRWRWTWGEGPWTLGWYIGSSDTSTTMKLSSLGFPSREGLIMKEECICGVGLSLLQP